MKIKNYYFGRIFVAQILFLGSFHTLAQTAQLLIEVNGIESNEGSVIIGVFNSEINFPSKGKEYEGIILTANPNGVTHIFENLPIGEYAIAAWHDCNDDGKLNKNLLGVPKENYGFSLNQYGRLGPPKYKNVAFELADGETRKLNIVLR